MDHYLGSHQAQATISLYPEGEYKDLIRPFLEVHEDYVRAQLAVVEEQWGSADGLLRDGYGLTDVAIKRFQTALVV